MEELAKSRKSKKAADTPDKSESAQSDKLDDVIEASSEESAEPVVEDAQADTVATEEAAPSEVDEVAKDAATAQGDATDAEPPVEAAGDTDLGDDTLETDAETETVAEEGLAGLEDTPLDTDEANLTDDVEAETEETEPEAPEPEPVAAQAPAPVQQPTGSPWPAIFGGVVAALLGFIAGRGDTLDGFLPASMQRQTVDISALESEQANLAEANAALQDRLATLEAAEPAVVSDFDAAPLTEGLDNLDSAIALLNDTIASLSDRVDVLEDRPAVAAPQEGVASSDELAALRDALDAQKNEIDDLSARAAEAEALAAEEARELLARAALVSVVTAVNTGENFEPALDEFEQASVAEVPDTLRTAAETGVPTLSVLQESFPDAARAGLAAARAEVPESEVQGITGFLRRQLGARSVVPREGDDPDAVLSRAEAALRDGDLDTALIEVDTLPQAAQEAMAGWIDAAVLRKSAQDAANALADSLNSN